MGEVVIGPGQWEIWERLNDENVLLHTARSAGGDGQEAVEAIAGNAMSSLSACYVIEVWYAQPGIKRLVCTYLKRDLGEDLHHGPRFKVIRASA